MGSANLTPDQITMRYPQSIIDWEMKHGIIRYEKNGMLYVAGSRPHHEICDSIRIEREQIEAEERKREREKWLKRGEVH